MSVHTTSADFETPTKPKAAPKAKAGAKQAPSTNALTMGGVPLYARPQKRGSYSWAPFVAAAVLATAAAGVIYIEGHPATATQNTGPLAAPMATPTGATAPTAKTPVKTVSPAIAPISDEANKPKALPHTPRLSSEARAHHPAGRQSAPERAPPAVAPSIAAAPVPDTTSNSAPTAPTAVNPAPNSSLMTSPATSSTLPSATNTSDPASLSPAPQTQP